MPRAFGVGEVANPLDVSYLPVITLQNKTSHEIKTTSHVRQVAPSFTRMCNAKADMRDPETIETELMEISATADDIVRIERIVAWCATHPDEVPFAMEQLMNRRKEPSAGIPPDLGPNQS